jgi:hypothetical protein
MSNDLMLRYGKLQVNTEHESYGPCGIMKAILSDNDYDSEGHVISTTQCNILGDLA